MEPAIDDGATALKTRFKTLWQRAGYEDLLKGQHDGQSAVMHTIKPTIDPLAEPHLAPLTSIKASDIDAALMMTLDTASDPGQAPLAHTHPDDDCVETWERSQTPLKERDQPQGEELPRLTLGGRHAKSDLELRGELGRGGMGVVMLARQRSLLREVAVKRIQNAHYDERAGAALIQEARIAGSLEHPNIIPIHSLGVDREGQPTLIMKRVRGVSWQRLINDPAHEAWDGLTNDRQRWHIETLIQVCRAIELAHSHRILHRDLKTENIMIGQYGEVYVLDWGIAAPISDEVDKPFDGLNTSPNGQMIGTPAFMAPEMTTGGPHTERTDIYLLGGILHECLTGQPRHAGDTFYEVIFKAYESAPAQYDSTIHPELAQIAQRATARMPSDRFATTRQLREALTHYLQHKESFDLCDAANERLKHIRDVSEATAAQSADLQLIYGEARFGYQQALNIWPENQEASQGLRALQVAMTRVEIKRGRLEAAEALLSTLDAIPKDIEAQLTALKQKKALEAQRLASLESHAHDTNINVALYRRGIAALVTSALMGLLSLGVLVQIHIQRVPLEPAMLFIPAAIGMVILMVVLLTFWRTINSNKLNQQLSLSMFLFIVSLVMGRATAWQMGVPPLTTLSMELSNGALLLGLIALFKDPRLWPAVGTFSLGWAVALFFPDWTPEVYSVNISLSIAHIGFIWIRASQRMNDTPLAPDAPPTNKS